MKDPKNVAITKTEAADPEAVWEGRVAAPFVDIYENRDELLVVADMPGIEQDSIQINLNKDQLVLEGRAPNFAENRDLLSCEFEPASYRRAFLVPKGIDAAKITAELSCGVLKVHLPKAEGLKPRQIPIKTI